MKDTIHRIASVLSEGQEGAVQRAIQNSFLVSADMAHALHPNYSDKHDADHAPLFQKGIVIKHNQNQRYATNVITATLFRWAADLQLNVLLHSPAKVYIVRTACCKEMQGACAFLQMECKLCGLDWQRRSIGV